MNNRIMMQLSFTGSSCNRVYEIYKLLDTIGIDVTILPSIDCGRMEVLLIPKSDLIKARKAFEHLNISAKEKEVIVLHVENNRGEIADISRKIGDGGISINYAFLGRISTSAGYLILECSDNKGALKALDGKLTSYPVQ